MSKIDQIIAYLDVQGISAAEHTLLPSFLDPLDELDGVSIEGLSNAKQTKDVVNLVGAMAESMSIASMVAAQTLLATDLEQEGQNPRVLDVCAAPGMKGLYMSYARPDIEYYCNDLSKDRLSRLKRLFDKHNREIKGLTHYDARFIDRAYEPESFDRVIIDAPCSAEGVALGGDEASAETWSPAKVKRLQQLQVAIVKSAWKLVRPGGRLVYATCTLNLNENERVLKKALGISCNTTTRPLQLGELPTIILQLQKNGTPEQSVPALRILPSQNSIGFFIASVSKNNVAEES